MTNRGAMCALFLAVVTLVQLSFPETATADSTRDSQWHLSSLGISDAHSIARGDGVTVAVIDTGVDDSHPDFGDSVVSGSEVNGPGDGRADSDGHGTSMAGLVAAQGRGPGVGALGIAPHSVVVPIKISNQRPLSVADAIDQATAKDVEVICLALSTTGDRMLEAAVQRAQAAGIVVVASGGNRPAVGIQAPAKYPGVVAAVGVDRNGNHADISIAGAEAVLAAPAVDIISTAVAGGYVKGTGTSASAAIIAGVAALVRSKFPELNATEVIHRMTATAIDRGAPGRDKEYGFGIVNPLAALTAQIPPSRASLGPSPVPTKDVASTPPSKSAAAPLFGFIILFVGLLALVGAVAFLSWRANKQAKVPR